MKKLIFIVIVLLMIFGADGFRTITFPGNPLKTNEAEAKSWTVQRVGNVDFYNSSDGDCATGQQVGNVYFYND